MKRSFRSVYTENEANGYQPGDEAAHVAAAALAQRADAPTIARLTDMVNFMEQIGGQFNVLPVRVQNPADPGEYNTEALVFSYETRDIKVQKLEPPSEVDGLPVTETHEPPTQVIVERPEAADPPSPEEEPVYEEGEPGQNGTEPEDESRERVRKDAELQAQEA